jgi:probable HAF family extracellular repeat protein
VGWAFNLNNQAVFAFVWKHDVMTSLGTVDGDQCSVADAINSKGQVVGESSPSCFSQPEAHAFLWENGGPAVDLNALIPAGSAMELQHPVAINDRGEIDGDGILPNGDKHAFLLIPCDGDHADVRGCDFGTLDAAALPQSNDLATHTITAQKALPALHRRGRFGVRISQP